MITPGRIVRSVAAISGGVAIALGGLAVSLPSSAAGATSAAPNPGVSAPGGIVPVVLNPGAATKTVVGPTVPNGQLRASSGGGATFVVNYDAGFNANPQAKAAFQFAVDQWAQMVQSPVTITIDASFGDLGNPSILGGAGPNTIFRDFTGAPMAGTWYPVALANSLAGTDLDPGHADIDATFSSTFPSFYFGTDGNTAGKVDFASVVLHELGHGLGFVGVMDVSGANGSCCLGGFPTVYDRFTTSNGTALLSIADGPTLATALQGQTVRFAGTNATAANSGTAPRLYAPNPWQPGSSYSHLDESTYPAGNPNALMTPGIGSNEVVHSAGPVTLGIFKDSGWVVGSPPTISVGSAKVVEGNSGTRGMRFNITLSKPSTRSISVNYTTADGTALAGSDYVARSGVATIPAGSLGRTITVSVRGDKILEPSEKLKFVISSPLGANLGTNAGAGTILNDDASSGVQISVGDASVKEGDQGDRTVTVAITLSAARNNVTTVDWASADGTASSSSDFDAATGTATFPALTTTAYVTFVLHPDTTVEGTEAFTVGLTNPSGAVINRATGTVTISDDD